MSEDDGAREYRRLSRCGVDNCPETRFYLSEGRWFCALNGHLREVSISSCPSPSPSLHSLMEPGRTRCRIGR